MSEFQCSSIRIPVWSVYAHPDLSREDLDRISVESDSDAKLSTRIGAVLSSVEGNEIKCFAMLNLQVELSDRSEDDEAGSHEAPYSAEHSSFPKLGINIEIVGYYSYRMSEEPSLEERLGRLVRMLRINGCAYLYGTLRPMLRNHLLNAVGVEYLLPSLNFADLEDDSILESFLETYERMSVDSQ